MTSKIEISLLNYQYFILNFSGFRRTFPFARVLSVSWVIQHWMGQNNTGTPCTKPHALMARDGLTKKTPAWHFLVPRGSFAVSPCKVLAPRVALQGPPASNSTDPTTASWNSMLRRCQICRGRRGISGVWRGRPPGVPRGPPKPCTGTQQNSPSRAINACDCGQGPGSLVL